MNRSDGESGTAAVGLDPEAFVRRVRLRVVALAVLLVVAGAGAMAYAAHGYFRTHLAPAVTGRAATVASYLRSDIERALRLGIPLTQLVGVEAFLTEARARHPHTEYIAVVAPDGRVLYASGELAGARFDGLTAQSPGRPSERAWLPDNVVEQVRHFTVLTPVRSGGGRVATVAIGVEKDFVLEKLQQLALDIGVIAMVAVFITYELVLLLLSANVVMPLGNLLRRVRAGAEGSLGRGLVYASRDRLGQAAERWNAATAELNERYRRLMESLPAGAAPETRRRLAEVGERFALGAGTARAGHPSVLSAIDVRLPLFLFLFAEELQKSFLPLYVERLYTPVSWLSAETVVGLPISIYMLCLALATPFAGRWVDRVGARAIFMAGLAPAVLGFLGAAAASSVGELILARSATAVGYAMITIAAQGYIADATRAGEQAQGMSSFVGVLMSASVCGTAIGGIIADRVGYREVFLVAVALALLAGMLGYRMLAAGARAASTAPRERMRLAHLRLVLANRRFLVLVVCVAIPAKIVLTGFLFYSVPILLSDLQASESEVGRTMMLYSIVIIFLGPWASRLADRTGRNWQLVFLGTLVSGLGLLIVPVRTDLVGVIAAVTLLAVGHAAAISPQLALVPQICKREIEQVGQTTVLSLLRTLERIGSVAGPLVMAQLATIQGYATGLAQIGLLIAACSLIFLVVYVRWRPAAR